MNILKFTRKRNGWYELLLDNDEKLLINEDLILKYDLLIDKRIGKNREKLLRENNYYLAYDKSVKYITVKVRSESEIRKYLSRLDIDEDNIDFVVKKLNDQGYLNDKLYASLYVKDRINLSNDGPDKIIANLNQHNIKSEYIDSAISEFDIELQRSRIDKLVKKQISTNTNKGGALLKQKILMNLINLGYDRSLILESLNYSDIDDSNIYEKEYEKIKEKLSKKYSGKELEYRIRQKLYQKGFRV